MQHYVNINEVIIVLICGAAALCLLIWLKACMIGEENKKIYRRELRRKELKQSRPQWKD